MKPRHVLLLLFLTFGFWLFKRHSLTIQPPASHPKEFSSSENPFGLMVGAPFGMGLETKIESARALGVSYYRPTTALFLDKWKGKCLECDAAVEASLKLVLTVRNGGGHGNPSHPPQDETDYADLLEQVVTAHRPAVLIVENEENSMELFYSGTPEQYHRQLRLACEVAHQHSIQCANGGFVSSLVIGLVYDDYRQQGKTREAEVFLNKALTTDKLSQYQQQQSKVESQLQRGKALLSGYKSAGADYVNFHWYSDSPEALAEAKAYLEAKTGLPAISNEMGQQKNTNPDQVTQILEQVVTLKMPLAVWYSVDTLSHGEAQGLTEANGTLRPNGQAFQQFISLQYPASPEQIPIK